MALQRKAYRLPSGAKFGANGGKNIFEHSGGQAPCIGIIARAVIAIE